MSEMEGQYQSALDAAVTEAFESMAFLEVRRVEEASSTPVDGSWRWAAVPFCAPVSGGVVIACPETLLNEIAETLFGMAPMAAEADVAGDTLAEIANTIAGAALAALSPAEEPIRVGLPVAGRGACDWPVTYSAYALDDGRSFRVGLQLAEADGA